MRKRRVYFRDPATPGVSEGGTYHSPKYRITLSNTGDDSKSAVVELNYWQVKDFIASLRKQSAFFASRMESIGGAYQRATE